MSKSSLSTNKTTPPPPHRTVDTSSSPDTASITSSSRRQVGRPSLLARHSALSPSSAALEDARSINREAAMVRYASSDHLTAPPPAAATGGASSTRRRLPPAADSGKKGSAKIKRSEVRPRESAPAPQYVDWSVSVRHPNEDYIQRAPALDLYRQGNPLRGTATAPPVKAERKKKKGGVVRRVWDWMRRTVFSREEFVEFAAKAGSVPKWQESLIHRLDAWGLPGWYKHLAFDVAEFFARKRVYVVILCIVLMVCYAVSASSPSSGAAMLGSVASTFTVADNDRPGLTFLAKYNNNSLTLPHKHPVVIIPGFITAALELWEWKGTCLERQSASFQSAFRQRMFGPQMLFLMASDPACWLELFGMSPTTGSDKPGIKVRADTGFTSIDYFMPGYWVWAKVLINLADIGYDPQSMAVMTYDWRLSPTKAHERDGLFFHIRQNLKFLCQKNLEPAVVISHSYGTTVALAFFKWSERREPGFMNKYVRYYINVGGVTMGIPKAVSAVLMGDAKDTITIPRPARRVLDTFVSQNARYNLTRSWSCLSAMFPRGCDDVWRGGVVRFDNHTSLDMQGVARFAQSECEKSGHTDCVRQMEAHMQSMDELPVLPQAPDTTVVCLYGVNKAAEYAYQLERLGENSENIQTNSSYDDQGVVLSDGDGTVPLGSLGYMCRAPNGWKQNVGRVVTIEHDHQLHGLSPLQLRGGVGSGDHVDILGNYDLLETILTIVSGIDHEAGLSAAANNEKKKNGNMKKEGEEEAQKVSRRISDRVYSNIDTLIKNDMQSCLAKKNNPIKAVRMKEDDNPFL